MLLPYFQQDYIEAGCDEAGRGCLAGPVFAAAVILPRSFSHPLLNDSKKIKEKDRFELRDVVQRESLAYAVASVDHIEIDKMNILNASIFAMHLALRQLQIRPEFIIVDGNRFKSFEDVGHHCIVKGDSKYFSIAAASILDRKSVV
jgi:ribonuclease HII